MNHWIPRESRSTWVLACLLACAVASLAGAQAPSTTGSTSSTTIAPEEIAAFESLEPRPEESIGRDLEAARGVKQTAESELATARSAEISAKGRAGIAKASLETTKLQLDLAKKEKREADAAQLDTLKKRQELELKFFERLTEMRQAAVARAEAVKSAADAREKAYEAERRLTEKRAELRNLPAGDPKVAEKTKEVREGERSALSAMNDAAGRSKDLAEKEQKLAEKRLNVHETVWEYRALP